MLKRYVSHDTIRNGQRYCIVGPELEDTPCVRCGGESVSNVCGSDGRYHHHGNVHLDIGRGEYDLVPLCNSCHALMQPNPKASLAVA